LNGAQLDALFTLTCKVTDAADDRLGFPQAHRPAPSAGGIHPIHVVINLPEDEAFLRYDPANHGFRVLRTDLASRLVRREVGDLVDAAHAAVLLFVAEPGMTAAKYSNADSLVWRDAGVLLGAFCYAAEALEMNCVPLGITGEPWVTQLNPAPGLAGVGVALLGSRS
jgi:hypothetical protein